VDFKIAKERVFLLQDKLTQEEAQAKSLEKKVEIFGKFNQLASLLSKPKDDDFEMTYSEHRYDPFWHINSRAHYVYERKTDYQIPVNGEEVKTVTVHKEDFEVTNKHIHVPVLEHCRQSFEEESYINGLNGQKQSQFKQYIEEIAQEVEPEKINSNVKKDDIVIPPQARVSAIMREMLARMIHGIQADKILEENIEVSCIDLYFRPVYSFKYLWKSKKKEAIAEIDGITGEVISGSRTFQEYLGKVIDADFLFDIGADAAGTFIPGGSIAVKVAKKYIDSKKK